MKTLTKFLISGTILAGGSGATWKAYDTFVPKTAEEWFEWKEIKKISEDNFYRGIFEDNKENLKALGIENLTSTSTIGEAAQKIKNWCETNLKKATSETNWETILQFCSLKFKTVKGILASKDTNDFISADDDYKVSLFFLKHDSNWKSKVDSTSNPDLEKLKSWCKVNLDKKISGANKHLYSGLNFFCKKNSIDTIEKLIKKKQKDWEISKENKWNEIFEAWKNTNTLLELFKKDNDTNSITSSTDKDTGGPKLKTWCEKKKEEKLTGDTEQNLISHIKAVCAYKSTDTAGTPA